MLDKLEFLIAVAREKHFGRAADSCGVAQPTLSQGIQALEELLNVSLVKRSSRFKGLTPEGERALVWARRMVGDARAMRQEISGLQNGIDAHIRIAAIPSAMSVVAALTTPFQLDNPTVRFSVITRSSAEVLDLLHQRDIDAGVTYIDNEPIGEVSKAPIYHERYLLLTTVDGPCGSSDRVTWAQLAAMPLCLLVRDLQQRRIIDGVLRKLGIEVTPMIETDSIVSLTAHVRTGHWVSIVPSSIIDAFDMNGSLRAIPIVEPEISHTVGLVVSQRYPVSPTVASLIQDASSRANLAVAGNDGRLI